MLTSKMRTALDYLEANAHRRLSYVDIVEGLGLKSKSSAHRLIVRLEERGFLVRHPYRARSIYLVRPYVVFPKAKYFVWDDEAKELKRWKINPTGSDTLTA